MSDLINKENLQNELLLIQNYRDELIQIIKHGRIVRRNKLDGLKEWKIIRKNIEEKKEYTHIIFINTSVFNIEQITTNCYDDWLNFTFDGIKFDTTTEHMHFFSQLFRIPHIVGDQMSYVKLAQIAYNIGQMITCIEEYEYDTNVLEIIKKYDLVNIFKYVK